MMLSLLKRNDSGTGKSALARARERLAARQEERRLARIAERISVHRCVLTNGLFLIVWRREADSKIFAVHETRKLAAGGGVPARSDGVARPLREFDQREFDFTGQQCPWCETEGFLHCTECGESVCAANTEFRDGQMWMACSDRCGWHGPVFPVETMPARDRARDDRQTTTRQLAAKAGG